MGECRNNSLFLKYSPVVLDRSLLPLLDSSSGSLQRVTLVLSAVFPDRLKVVSI